MWNRLRSMIFRNTQAKTSAHNQVKQADKVKPVDTDRVRKVHGVSNVTVVRHVQSYNLPTAQKTHLRQRDTKISRS